MFDNQLDESRAFMAIETQLRGLYVPGYELSPVSPREIREGHVDEDQLVLVTISFPGSEMKCERQFSFYFEVKVDPDSIDCILE